MNRWITVMSGLVLTIIVLALHLGCESKSATPCNIQGRWSGNAGGYRVLVELAQSDTKVSGTARCASTVYAVSGWVDGDSVSITMNSSGTEKPFHDSPVLRFEGTLKNGMISGKMTDHDGVSYDLIFAPDDSSCDSTRSSEPANITNTGRSSEPVNITNNGGNSPPIPTATGAWTLDFGGTSIPLHIDQGAGTITGTENVLGVDYPVTGTLVASNMTMSIAVPGFPFILTGTMAGLTTASGTSTRGGIPKSDWTATKD